MSDLITAGWPIQRLELEFIPSNVTSFDHIVKIHIIRSPGLTGQIDFIAVHKYVVDESEEDLFDEAAYYLRYMSNSVYFSNEIFMGGIDLRTYAKDYATLDIRSVRLEDFKFLLDFTVNQNDILLYNMDYRYKGVEYSTPVVTSYKPLAASPLGGFYERPCITLRNLRYRGPNESQKYSNMHKEIFCDIRRLTAIQANVIDDINTKASIMDNNFNSLYNILDSIQHYKNSVMS